MTPTPRAVAALIEHHNALSTGLPHDDRPRTIRDAYGLTYTGAVADLALLALGRKDLSPGPADPALATSSDPLDIRRAARLLLHWFNSEHINPQRAAALRAMTPSQVCRIVAHFADYLGDHYLDDAGPHAQAVYTEYFTTLQLGKPGDLAPFPSLGSTASPAKLLDRGTPPDRLPDIPVTVNHTLGNDSLVAVAVTIDATEELRWSGVQGTIMVSPHELPRLLWQPSALRSRVAADASLLDSVLHPDEAYSANVDVLLDDYGPGGPGQAPEPMYPFPSAPEPDEPGPHARTNTDGDTLTVYRHPADPTVLRLVYNDGEGGIYELGRRGLTLRDVPRVPPGWLEMRPSRLRESTPDTPPVDA